MKNSYNEQLKTARDVYLDRDDAKGMGYLAALELGAWLTDKFQWDWYITHTFRDRCRHQSYKVDYFYCQKKDDFCGISPSNCEDSSILPITPKFADARWQSWLNMVLLACKNKGLSRPHYVRATEFQELRESRTIHYHALIGGVGDIRRLGFKDLWELNGHSRVVEYDPNRGAGFYLGKYLTKYGTDLRMSHNLRHRMN